jgi:hypothetical protein
VARIEFTRTRVGTVAGAEPRLVLRVVSPAGIEDKIREEPLADEVLDNLRALFQRLPDGHYRIYRIEPDGAEWLVADVIVREGRNIDAADEAAQTVPPAPQAEESAPPAPKPADQERSDQPLSEQTSQAPRDMPAAAVALAAGSLAPSAPWRRRRLRPDPCPSVPHAPSKARRLVRRLRNSTC